MRITIRHVTTYDYPQAASHAVLALRLTPVDLPGQRVEGWRIEAPGMDPDCNYVDAFGNAVHLAAAPAGHGRLRIAAAGTVETADRGGIVGWTREAASREVFLRSTAATAADAAIGRLAQGCRAEGRLATMHALMAAVHAAVAYRADATDARTTASAALAAGAGVCQDHAHVMIAAARSLGIPARYVTGYLLLEDGGRASAHHAWMEAEIETLGWVGFDAANDLCPTERYVRLACGLDAAAAAPIRGVRRGGAGDAMAVEVLVEGAGD